MDFEQKFFCEIDLFDFTGFCGLDFLNFLVHYFNIIDTSIGLGLSNNASAFFSTQTLIMKIRRKKPTSHEIHFDFRSGFKTEELNIGKKKTLKRGLEDPPTTPTLNHVQANPCHLRKWKER